MPYTITETACIITKTPSKFPCFADKPHKPPAAVSLLFGKTRLTWHLFAFTSKTISNAEYHLFSIDSSTVFKLISI